LIGLPPGASPNDAVIDQTTATLFLIAGLAAVLRNALVVAREIRYLTIVQEKYPQLARHTDLHSDRANFFLAPGGRGIALWGDQAAESSELDRTSGPILLLAQASSFDSG
jgi:hypothetical protein